MENLYERDLLVVLGDHGMTASGDHGGESTAELDAALFVYSSLGFKQNDLADLGPTAGSIAQIDLVPTLAFLTGVPVPYSSLGVCVEQLMLSDADFHHCLFNNFMQVRICFIITYNRDMVFDV